MNPASSPTGPRLVNRQELTEVQRWAWTNRFNGRPVRAVTGAVRLSGRIDEDRLAGALAEVVEALPMLRTGFTESAGAPAMVHGGGRPAVIQQDLPGSDERCVAELVRDRDRQSDPLRDPLVRFHLLRRAPQELVLGLVADPLVLDPRSVYLVLGALLQAYVGRLRATQYPPLRDGATAVGQPPGRRAWWADRLRSWREGHPPPRTAVTMPGRLSHGHRLRLDATRWQALTRVAGAGGNSGWLAMIALLTWWRKTHIDRDRPVLFTATLDLRDYLGLGAVVGPLTDRIAFAVDLDGFEELSFRDLVRRSHAGMLDTVVHYLPYRDLVALGQELGAPVPPDPTRPWDLAVHYCPLPPASTYTRGEQTLAGQGLSIELFAPSELAAGGPTEATVDIHLAESGTGMALVANVASGSGAGATVDEMLGGVAMLVQRVVTDPGIPLGRLAR